MDITNELLRENIIKMASLVENLLEKSLLLESQMDDLWLMEDEINSFHTDNDDLCFKYIALKHPSASDLRSTLTYMKMNAELERIGDQSISIHRYLNHLKSTCPAIEQMARIVKKSLRKSIDSFVHSNTTLATEIISRDHQINEMNRDILFEYLQLMKSNKIFFEEGFSIIRIAKNLERIGDLCTNIGEAVVFMVSGTDIRHNPELKGIIVDKDHKAPSIKDFLSDIDKDIDRDN